MSAPAIASPSRGPELGRLLELCLRIDGALGVALAESASGLLIAAVGTPPDHDMALGAAGATEMLRARQSGAARRTEASRSLEDIVITSEKRIEMVRPIAATTDEGLFLYLLLDRDAAAPETARRQVASMAPYVSL